MRLGERPRTVAFGDNDTFNILDVTGALNIERYGRVNENAASPEYLYADRALLASEHNSRFLRRCIAGFHIVNFADQATGRIYLRIESGAPVCVDAALHCAATLHERRPRSICTAAAAAAAAAAGSDATLGQWGTVRG